ncbi:non-ribosomal peptide synthetase [Rhodococcus sp. G-MC3]|uniref:non-ribosomal peptide synthetase n=1 Tax=Rhodococcus sp. G-MC3 TaxID=3046209 RepID=UPI0024B93FF2|nr:non-ribosomal peptide synthetase [Rhodococcus sp. G-MC3]MDJ0393765.1 non-ribosomal peptide synthetase [Rhodococcus sp. G-MC3]
MSIQDLDARTYPALAPLCRPNARDTLMDRLCEVAYTTPHATALVAEDGAVTFDRLLHRTYALARKIARIAPDVARPIAIETTCTVEAITLMLGVIAAGRGLVPLDPKLPDIRRDHIVDQSNAVRVQGSDIENVEESSIPLPVATGERIALIAFTSGSTGTAKGVLLSNRMCLSKAYEVGAALGLSPSDRVGNALPVSFGAGINTVFAGILSGATVYCRDPRNTHSDGLIEWISEHSLTTLHCSPSLVRSIAAVTSSSHSPSSRPGAVHAVPDNIIPSLKFVTTYGEPLHARDVIAFRGDSSSVATFVNWYATTEAGAVAFHKYRVNDPLPQGFLAAGMSPNGKSLDIVRSDGKLARQGELGQIRLTAECLAVGYLDLPEQTRERFTTDSGHRRYWTGDVGRIDDRGVLQLVGRVDDAVNIRGYQVEPAEVESALRSLDGLSDAFVAACEDDSITELEAFFVGDACTEADARVALREQLPEWMVPKYITRLDALPRTERGKVDRAALPSSAHRDPQGCTAVLVGATENWLAHIVARELDVTSLHRDDDFAELGATSLVTIKILAEIRVAFHVELAAEDLVDAMTVRTLARVIDDRHAAADRDTARSSNNPILVPLRSEGTGTPLFVVAGAGVPAVGLTPLARRLGGRPIYALQAKGLETRALPHRTIAGAARAYVREIQKVQPHGPYTLAGHSLGGWIALEMAEILSSRGESVERVILLDPRLFRWLLDKLPNGTDLVAAPPDQGNPVFKSSPAVVLERAWRVASAGLIRFPATERWLAFGIIGGMALKRHTPKPWDGPVTVVVTESNTPERRSWSAIATGELDITEVQGHHIGLVREPVVATVAAILDTTLDSTQ